MARNIVKDYIEYDREKLNEYIDIITEKALVGKLRNMIVDTYINIRYYNMYESIKKNPIDNIEYYVIEEFKKKYNDKNVKQIIPLIVDALIIIRYVILLEKYIDSPDAEKQLKQYEDKMQKKYDKTPIIVADLIREIKLNLSKKKTFLEELLSEDFSVAKRETNLPGVYDLGLENDVKMPDLFSDVAVNRVYNTGAINEDKMLVYYVLATREILLDMINYNYDSYYLIDFPDSLVDKKGKSTTLFKIFEDDYLKEKLILKVNYSDYKEKKDSYDYLIHEGLSFAVFVNDDVKDDIVLLNVFSYIIVDNEEDKNLLSEYSNVITL